MRKTLLISTLTAASMMLAACSGPKASSTTSSFPIKNSDGNEIGKIEITSASSGGVDLLVTVKDLTPGSHAMHFHEFGRCDGPDFKSAGGHYKFEVTNGKVNLKTGSLPALMDADGTALIIHAGEDDYTSQPSGAAGPRVACAVISGG